VFDAVALGELLIDFTPSCIDERGPKGAFYRLGKYTGIKPAYNVVTIDTNGSGDSFMEAVHFCLREKDLGNIRTITLEEIERVIDFANAANSLLS
jgi:sugar/nucleoside kinase (ribokinase family)